MHGDYHQLATAQAELARSREAEGVAEVEVGRLRDELERLRRRLQQLDHEEAAAAAEAEAAAVAQRREEAAAAAAHRQEQERMRAMAERREQGRAEVRLAGLSARRQGCSGCRTEAAIGVLPCQDWLSGRGAAASVVYHPRARPCLLR
jgi:hypothetical protein